MTSVAPTQVVRGACGHDCPDTCGWVVEVRDGTAEKLFGDPLHPFTRGTLCAKVNHYLERVYHPDRVLYPLKRVGCKGEGRFERVSWDAALTDIASRWHAISAEWGAEAILPYSSAGVQGLIQMASLDRRLFGSMGCSHLERSICGAVAAAGMSATIGCGTGIDPEAIVHSRFIVLWGTNTIVTNLHFWPLVREAQRRGAKLVVVDPVRTRTAEAADWHLAIRPGSDAALALAMMHVMIRDGLVDRDYVSRHAIGYEALASRAREYSPARVAGVAGISEQDIERFAREYATTQPSLLRPLIGIEHHRNGAMQFRALACLPVLSGAWKHRGGGMARSTHMLQFETLAMDRVLMPDVYKPGVRTLNMRDLGNDLCNGDLRPPNRSLMVYGSNPMVSMPNQRRIRDGLLRDDLFTVVHDLFVTDTARFADYVLPATSQIEHLDLSPAWGHLYLALNRPAIAPRGESLANTELFRQLARALGRTEDWLFESDEAIIEAALDSGHPWLEGITYERLWEQGYARLRCPDDWRPFAEGGFATPSGKAELYSDMLGAQGHDPLPSAGELPARGGLQLITGKALHFLNSGYGNMDRHRRRAGDLTIDVHPDDATERRLADGDRVRVWNEQGEVRAICNVTHRVRPGVVWMPFGGLTDAGGARRSVNVLTPEAPTDWGGGSGLYDAFVEVTAVGTTATEAGARGHRRATSQAFLLSPAFCGGRRAAALLRSDATSPLAQRLRSGALTLGEVFSFVSGLYFRGKLAYARAFAESATLVITPTRGLLSPESLVSVELLEEFSASQVSVDAVAYRLPLERDLAALAERLSPETRVVLLGSIATDKYVDVIRPLLGERLHFPSSFVGRGDMSRGGLLLRSASSGIELEYVPLRPDSVRRGRRPAPP